MGFCTPTVHENDVDKRDIGRSYIRRSVLPGVDEEGRKYVEMFSTEYQASYPCTTRVETTVVKNITNTFGTHAHLGPMIAMNIMLSWVGLGLGSVYHSHAQAVSYAGRFRPSDSCFTVPKMNAPACGVRLCQIGLEKN